MKTKNKLKKLKARQDEWEAIRTDGQGSRPGRKKNHKPSGGILEYTKPGSLR